MQLNDEFRAQLDESKTRNQDVVKVLQGIMSRNIGLSRFTAIEDERLPAMVISMFSSRRRPGREHIKKLIDCAKSASPQLLDLMVSIPVEVPVFCFKELFQLFRLSGV